MSKRAVPYQTTIHVRDHCLCLHLQRAARTIGRRFDEALRAVGLTNGQFSLLMALNRPEAPTIGIVAETIGMDRTTLTAALKPLERRGLVTVAADRDDRRVRRIVLSEEGLALLARAVPVWVETHAAIEAEAPGVDWDGMRGVLREVT